MSEVDAEDNLWGLEILGFSISRGWRPMNFAGRWMMYLTQRTCQRRNRHSVSNHRLYYRAKLHIESIEQVMKEGIHPNYRETTVKCGCGSTFTTRSVRDELKVDICNECHPFYTGKLKFVDTAGRIEKFKNKFASGSYASLQKPKKGKKK